MIIDNKHKTQNCETPRSHHESKPRWLIIVVIFDILQKLWSLKKKTVDGLDFIKMKNWSVTMSEEWESKQQVGRNYMQIPTW